METLSLILDNNAAKRFAPDQETICTGQQVAMLIAQIEACAGQYIWFASDMQAISPSGGWLAQFPDCESAVRIGDGNVTVGEVRKIAQFLSGVLYGVPAYANNPNVRFTHTEDTPPRLEPPVCVQIHLFDTSSIEIYTTSDTILRALSRFVYGRSGDSLDH